MVQGEKKLLYPAHFKNKMAFHRFFSLYGKHPIQVYQGRVMYGTKYGTCKYTTDAFSIANLMSGTSASGVVSISSLK